MKKIIVFISMLLVLVSLTACAPKEAEQVVITFKQNKPEIDDALQAYATAYEAATGVKVNAVSCGGGSCT